MRSTRLASLATVLSLVIACGGGGGSQLADYGAQAAIVANVSISSFMVTPSTVGSRRSYLVSFTMTETSGAPNGQFAPSACCGRSHLRNGR
jgi:hypothetical protein